MAALWDGDTIADRDEIDPMNSTTKAVADYVATYGSNQTMMDNQFNALLRENVPPVLVTATAHSDVTWDWCWFIPCPKRTWTTVYVKTLDVAPQTVTVTAGWLRRSASADLPAGLAEMTVEVDIDFLFDYLVRYDVRVGLEDASGNAMDPPYMTKVDGLFAGLLEFLEWLGSAVAAIADAILKALNFLFEIIKGIALAILDAVFRPLLESIESWGRGVGNAVDQGFVPHSPILFLIAPLLAVFPLNDAMFSGAFFYIVLAIMVVIGILHGLLTAFNALTAGQLGVLEGIISDAAAKFLIAQIVGVWLGFMLGAVSVMTLLYAFKPEADPFWAAGVGLSVISLANVLVVYLLADTY